MAAQTLFVSNFPFATAEAELRSLFEAHTPVVGIRIITDRDTGRSRGFAFIEVPTDSDANAAIDALNETMLNGRRLVVNPARGRGAADEKAPNASASTLVAEPFKHRIVIDWVANEGRYTAEVADLGLTAHADTLQEVVRRVQAQSRASAATAAGSDSAS